MNVLVDVGNTRIKWCVENDEVLEQVEAIVHKPADFIVKLRQSWLKLDKPQKVAIACVSKNAIADQIIELASDLWPGVGVLVAKSSAQGFSVVNAYQQPEKLGVDRWLGLIALRHYYPGDSCVVDCGTAITIDVLNQEGLHLGGLITPGLQLMKRALFQGTADLSCVEQVYQTGLSDFTESAIYTGTLFAAAGLIEKTINDLIRCQTLVLTGGDALLIAQVLNVNSIVDLDLILKGLALYCKEGVIK